VSTCRLPPALVDEGQVDGSNVGAVGVRRLWVLEMWPLRRWMLAAASAAGAALVLGIPTGVIRTPLYTRMTPVLWWNAPVLAVSALLLGLLAATYLRAPGPSGDSMATAATGGGLTSVFAIGCPVCNKLVVLAIGATGALRWFAPLQPLLAIAAIGILGGTLWKRLGGELACPTERRQNVPDP
jgi:hypothetical protein